MVPTEMDNQSSDSVRFTQGNAPTPDGSVRGSNLVVVVTAIGTLLLLWSSATYLPYIHRHHGYMRSGLHEFVGLWIQVISLVIATLGALLTLVAAKRSSGQSRRRLFTALLVAATVIVLCVAAWIAIELIGDNCIGACDIHGNADTDH